MTELGLQVLAVIDISPSLTLTRIRSSNLVAFLLLSPQIAMMAVHKFSLVFENSLTDDGVTEKWWGALVAGTVPIYMGAKVGGGGGGRGGGAPARMHSHCPCC